MLLGLAGGKVGDLVFYRDGGEQRTRTRVIPKNPRSPKQMAQRVRIANVAALYRLLAPIVRDSFSNRPSNQSGYNAMASGAIELSPFMTREMANASAVLPMPAVISKGTLPTVAAGYTADEQNIVGLSLPNLSSNPSMTFGAISQRIIDQYSGLQDGDKLTFVILRFSVEEGADGDVYSGAANFVEFVLDVNSTEVAESSSDYTLVTNYFALPNASTGLNADSVAAVAIVASRVDGGGSLQTSFARLLLNDAAQSLYDGYRTEDALSDALKSYTNGSVQLLR